MTWFGGIVAFVIIWWCVLFMVLPVGVKSPEEAGEEVLPGHATSAPVNPRMWLKVGLTTAIATVLLGVFWLILEYDPFGFREYVR